MYDGQIEVVAKSTGLKQYVPAEWLDHPTLGKNFELPPSARADGGDGGEVGLVEVDGTSAVAERPDAKWNNDRIQDWAAEHDIELADGATKAEMLAAIDAALSVTDQTTDEHTGPSA